MNMRTLVAGVARALVSASSTPLADSTSAGNADIRELRNATVAFHSLQNAIDAEWTEPLTPCLSSPQGAMGYHCVNWSIFFDNAVDPVRPELLVYAPTPSGGRQLVAVEYLVFDSALNGAPVPEPFGQRFHYNPAVDAWVLHVWLWRGNPNGLFADWNPNVQCD